MDPDWAVVVDLDFVLLFGYIKDEKRRPRWVQGSGALVGFFL